MLIVWHHTYIKCPVVFMIKSSIATYLDAVVGLT